jgi:ABC-type branched-subunit amino acid transport system substrate-binding protein
LLPAAGARGDDPARAGAQIAVDEANADGGFRDAPMQLVVGEPPSTNAPADVRTAADALVAKGIDVLIATGPGTVDFVPEVSAQGVLVFVTGDGDPLVSLIGAAGTVYQLAPSLLDEQDALVFTVSGANDGASATVLGGSAPASFVDGVEEALKAKGVAVTHIDVDPKATSYEDVAKQAVATKTDVLLVLTGDESPAVLAWLRKEGVDFSASPVYGWTGNVNDVMGKAFTDGAAFAPAVS